MNPTGTSPILPRKTVESPCRFAVGIVAQNVAPRLAGTIRDALALTPKVLLVDLASNDGSSETAAKLGVEILTLPGDTERAQARNRIITHLEEQGDVDWLLWMEPGERFDPKTRTAFDFYLLSQTDPGRVCLMTVWEAYFPPEDLPRVLQSGEFRQPRCERDEEAAEVRFMPLNRGLYFTGHLRETVFLSLTETGLGICAMPGRLIAPYALGTDAWRQLRAREERDILEAMERQGLPIVEDLLFYRADVRLKLGDLAGARDDYETLLNESTYANMQLESSYRLDDIFSLRPDLCDDRTAFLLSVIEKFPLDFQLLTLLGLQLQRMQRHDMAVRTFETAVNYGQMSFDVRHRRHIRDMALIALSNSYRLLGSSRLAMDVLEKHLDSLEEPETVAAQLLDMSISSRQEIKAQQYAALLWNGRDLAEMRGVVLGAVRAASGAWEAAALPLESAYVAGCRNILCLRWYALTLLALSRFEDALPVLEDWNRADPAGIEAKAYRFAASRPERFVETLREIQEAQRIALGIDSLDVLGFRDKDSRKKETEELAWSILGLEEEEPDVAHQAAMKEITANSGSMSLDLDEALVLPPARESDPTELSFRK